MWISDFAIRNPVVTIVLMLALAGFGALALAKLDTDEFPQVEPPVVVVGVPYPGAAPGTVEREVVDHMEEAFASISGVHRITSTSFDGYARIVIEFVFQKNLQQATQDVRDKISEIRQDLPPEMKEPVLARFNPDDMPIVSVALHSTKRSVAQLTRMADPGITRKLRSLPGVAEVRVSGGLTREMSVLLRPEDLAARDIGVGQVVQALEQQNLAAPVGRLHTALSERTIRLRGRLTTPDEFGDLVIGGSNGSIVRLRDVANVRDGTEEPRTLALFNGEPAVGIDIVKTTGSSTTAVSAAVRKRLAQIKRTLPHDVDLRVVRDSGVRVEQSVNDVQQSLIEGALLTVLVVFLFLNSWRSTIITGLALPVSVLASFIAVRAFGFTLNTMSLLGLSLAIGILIDDAIVVRENIVRHMEMGKDHVTAAREGTAEIGLAVAATTFSIVVVFVPIAFMGGLAEQWFAPFALTIACSVMVSLLVSFSLDPMLSAVWPDPQLESGRRGPVGRAIGHFNAWLDRQTSRYKRVIGWALRHRLSMVLLALATFAGALALPATGAVGSEFFAPQDRSEFTIIVDTPPGSSLDYTHARAEAAARMARSMKQVAYTYTTIGDETGAVDRAYVYVHLVPKAQRELSQQQVVERLRAKVKLLGGAQAAISANSFGTDRQIQVKVSGPDIDELNRLAAQVEREVRKVPGAVDINLSTKGTKPEVVVQLDRDLAGSLGVSVAQVAQSLRPAFAGLDAGDWVDPDGETRDVMVRLAPEARRRPGDVESLPLTIREANGQVATIPLGHVAKILSMNGPAQIDHLDRERVITVGANTEGRPLSEVVGGIEKRLANVQLPTGYSITQGGQTQDQRDVFSRIFTSLGTAVVLMYMILVIQFRSFLDPIPIMGSLPLSLIGVMLALLLTGSTLNIMSMIGIILLVGIVAKNAILLIDFAKWSERRGMDRKTALIEAGGVRLRPILMTSVAIVAGMTPVALGYGEGADFRAPLGRAVIGGVITATVLTLLVIPTFYDILADWRESLISRLRGRKRGQGGGGGSAQGERESESEREPLSAAGE